MNVASDRVTLGDMSIEDVAPIFERINSTGTPLTIVDLMRAATWSPEFDLIDTIDALLSAMASKGFGAIDKKVVLRNLSAAAGGGFSTDSIDELRKLQPPALKAAAEDTEKSYLRTVDFLATQMNVPSAQIIPYSNQVTVLAEIFRRITSPTSAQYAAITQWLWRTAVAGYFSGWNTGEMASDLKAVANFADGNGADIAVDITPPRPEIWTTRQFRANNAHAKLLAIILAHLRPIDLLTGQLIDPGEALAWTNQREFHHFFPRHYLENKGIARQRLNASCKYYHAYVRQQQEDLESAGPPPTICGTWRPAVGGSNQPEPHAVDVDDPAFASRGELATQAASVAVQRACGASHRVSPDRTQQLLPAEDAPGIAGEVNEQVVLHVA